MALAFLADLFLENGQKQPISTKEAEVVKAKFARLRLSRKACQLKDFDE